MNCAVKTDELKKSFHKSAFPPDSVRALEKARVSANRARPRSIRLEIGADADWLSEAGSRLWLRQSASPRLVQRANTRRPRAPLEDEPEREAL